MWRVVARGPGETSPPSPHSPPHSRQSDKTKPSSTCCVRSPLELSLIYQESFCFYRFYSAFCNTHSDHHSGVEVSCVTQWVLSYADLETYTQSNRNPSALYLVRPAQTVTWRTVATIIRVVLLLPYLRIRGVSLSSIHYTVDTVDDETPIST